MKHRLQLKKEQDAEIHDFFNKKLFVSGIFPA
jgi:hypothetical protein